MIGEVIANVTAINHISLYNPGVILDPETGSGNLLGEFFIMKGGLYIPPEKEIIKRLGVSSDIFYLVFKDPREYFLLLKRRDPLMSHNAVRIWKEYGFGPVCRRRPFKTQRRNVSRYFLMEERRKIKLRNNLLALRC